MKYSDINEVIQADGMRLVLLRGFPSPWGQAAKAMMEYKGLNFTAGALEAGGENSAVEAWSGVNSAPVVAWNDEPPLNRWDDILMLLERLAPDRSLVPEDPAGRVQLFGLAYSICGQLGFGWNRRLDGVHARAQSGQPVGWFGEKYGYNETDGALASDDHMFFVEGEPTTIGKERVRPSWTGYFTAYPDYVVYEDELHDQEDAVYVVGHTNGSHVPQELETIPSSVIWRCVIDEFGKVSEWSIYPGTPVNRARFRLE